MAPNGALNRVSHSPSRLAARLAAAPFAIQPLGEVPFEELRALERILAEQFGAKAVVLAPVAVPREAYSPGRGQHDADVLLDELFGRLPERCLRVVGVTEADLFIAGRTFVFGYAHLSDGMAIYSLARLRESFYGRPPDPAILGRRIERAVVHEIGHTFGASHCEDPGCVMHAVTHVETLDALCPIYCARCLSRVEVGLGTAPWSARGRWERGLAWLRRRVYARAVEALEHAVSCAPLEPSYHHDLGVAKLASGDRDGARAAFLRAAELRPEPEAEPESGDEEREAAV